MGIMPPPRPRDPADEGNLLMEELRSRADRICRLILASGGSDPDSAVERSLLWEWCERTLPDRLALYEMVYESRFERLIEQFGRDR
jgi:hypothetical protein